MKNKLGLVALCMLMNNTYAVEHDSKTSKLMNILYNKCSENSVSSANYLLDIKNKLTSDKTISDSAYKKMQYILNNKNCLSGITDALNDYKNNRYRLSYYNDLKNDEGKSIFDEKSKVYGNDPSIQKIAPKDLLASQIATGEASSIYGYKLVGYAFNILE